MACAKIPYVVVVVGLRWGDEGKGKVVYHLIKNGKFDFCVRFNGGPNAGHTIYVDGKKVVTHAVPSGALHRIMSVIGPNCLIDPVKLEKELSDMEKIVPDIRQFVKIDRAVHLITQAHIDEDRAKNTIGTTGCGMGPCYRDKYMRIGTRVDSQAKIGELFCGCEVVDCSETVRKVPSARILAEGAQGIELDISSEYYPYVTSGHMDSGFVCSIGVPPQSIQEVWGLSKAYDTYVGKMVFEPEGDVDMQRLRELGGEFGATTGRPRQCQYLNLDGLISAAYKCGCTHLVVNKCDILEKFDKFYLTHNGQLVQFTTMEEMKQYITKHVTENTLIQAKNIFYSYTPEAI